RRHLGPRPLSLGRRRNPHPFDDHRAQFRAGQCRHHLLERHPHTADRLHLPLASAPVRDRRPLRCALLLAPSLTPPSLPFAVSEVNHITCILGIAGLALRLVAGLPRVGIGFWPGAPDRGDGNPPSPSTMVWRTVAPPMSRTGTVSGFRSTMTKSAALPTSSEPVSFSRWLR